MAERFVKYGRRNGLDGPYTYPNGKVLYFDPKEQAYWDPTTDFYVPAEEVETLKQSLFDRITGNKIK